MHTPPLSPLPGRLSSFEHAYAVAIQIRQTAGAAVFIVRTYDPLQPFRVSCEAPIGQESTLASVA